MQSAERLPPHGIAAKDREPRRIRGERDALPSGASSAVGETDSLKSASSWPLLIFCVLVPLQILYAYFIPPLAPGLNLLNAVVLLSIFACLARRKAHWRDPPRLKKVVIWFMVVWTISLFVGQIVYGGWDPRNVSDLKDTMIPPLMFFVTYYSVRTRKHMSAIMIATMVALPYMFLIFYVENAAIDMLTYDDNKKTVGGTMLLGSNGIGAFYATYTLVLLCWLIVYMRRLIPRIIVGTLIALNTYCLVYSYSRGAYVAVIGGAVAMGWLFKGKKVVIWALVIVLASGAISPLFPAPVRERFSTIFASDSKRDASAESRFDFWTVAGQLFVTHPVTGIGFQTFPKLSPYGLDTHNFFIKAMVEQGIAGIIVVYTMFKLFLTNSFRLFRRGARDPMFRALGAGMFGCTVAVMLGSIFGDRFSYYPLISYFWIYMALVEAGLRIIAAEDGPDKADVPAGPVRLRGPAPRPNAA